MPVSVFTSVIRIFRAPRPTSRHRRFSLNSGGHGPEWERVFRVTAADRDRVWTALAASAADSPIFEIRDRGVDGIVCGVRGEVTIGGRSATVTTSWHYATPDSAPRLATAYPRP